MRKLSGYGPSLIVLATAALVLLVGPRAVQQLTYEQTRTRIIQARHSLESGTILDQLNQAYRDIATLVEPSVVHISAQYWERDVTGKARLALSTGSGWVYDELGHIVTNHHVVQDAQRIEVQLHNGELRDATLVGSDTSTDIAVIKIEPGRLHPAIVADPDHTVNQGDMVFAFGSPFDFRFSMSSGVVSGKGRTVNVIRDEFGRRLGYENFIQVDAAINPGNSGGPLTDFRGRVIGMNTAIATNGRRGSFEEGQFAGVGLAIPIDMIQPVVTQLIERGYVEKGFLGVNVAEINAMTARQLQFTGSGVLISWVDPDGPADAGGVLPDDIVTHINNRPVATVPQLQSMVSSMLPGENARLTIWRFDREQSVGRTIEITVTLKRLDTLRAAGKLPPDQSRTSITALGIARMATSSPELARQYGATYHAGVLLQELVENSTLAMRLEPGSTIVEVRERPVRDVEEFLAALREEDLRLPGTKALVIKPGGEHVIVDLRVQ